MLPPQTLDGTTLYQPGAFAGDAATAGAASQTHAWKDGGSFGFHDVLDALNPLQHIPIVGTLYRWATGDKPGTVARIVGDTLYSIVSGPIGVATGLLNLALSQEIGQDPGELVMATLTGSPEVKLGEAAAQPATAAATSDAPTPAIPAATPAAAETVRPPPSPEPAATIAPVPPLMPLHGGAPRPAAPESAALSPAEQAFMAQNAAHQRTLFGARGAAGARSTNQPIALQLTGPLQPGLAPRPLAARPALPPLQPAAATPPAAPALPQNPPVDIPQRMLEALDKYSRIQQQRGQSVDVSP